MKPSPTRRRARPRWPPIWRSRTPNSSSRRSGPTCSSGTAGKLRFPREFIWLGGAPGAGKGTNTPFIARARDITAPPIVISSLLTSPQAVAIKNAGQMVGDREVIGLLLEELLDPRYHDGVIVDGFPRTKVQVECLKLFYHAMLDLDPEARDGSAAERPQADVPHRAAVRHRRGERPAATEARPGDPRAQPPGRASRGSGSCWRSVSPTSTRSCAGSATRRSRTRPSTPSSRCARSSTSTSSTPRAICPRCSRTSSASSPTRVRWNSAPRCSS